MSDTYQDGMPKEPCPICASTSVRACDLGEDEQYLFGLDHLVCEKCGSRWVDSNGWLWLMQPMRLTQGPRLRTSKGGRL